MGIKKKEIPPYVDFPEYNEFTQDYLWPVTVKYNEQPEINFSISKSDTMKAFQLIDDILINDLDKSIVIGSRSFERKNIDFITFEGRTYDFYEE